MKRVIVLFILVSLFAAGCAKNNSPRRFTNDPKKPIKRTEDMTETEHKIALPPAVKEDDISLNVEEKMTQIEMIEIDEDKALTEASNKVTPPVFKEPDTQPIITPPVVSPPVEKTPPVPPKSSIAQVMNGFRVQVAASSSKDNANTIRAEAMGLLGREKVYVQFVDPYWKVRVGNCKTRDEAEVLKERVRDLGYSDAWIVQSEVEVQ